MGKEMIIHKDNFFPWFFAVLCTFGDPINDNYPVKIRIIK